LRPSSGQLVQIKGT